MAVGECGFVVGVCPVPVFLGYVPGCVGCVVVLGCGECVVDFFKCGVLFVLCCVWLYFEAVPVDVEVPGCWGEVDACDVVAGVYSYHPLVVLCDGFEECVVPVGVCDCDVWFECDCGVVVGACF